MIDSKQLTIKYLSGLDSINSVLDLGCGKGRKSLRFARKGIKVTGIDKKDYRIKQKNFEFVKENLLEFKFTKKYNLIICSLVLHFLKKEKAIKIFKKIQENTSKQGYNFLICMSDLDNCSKEKPDNFYPTLEELKGIYKDWKIIKSDQDFTDYEEHGGLKRHRHNLIFLLVRK